MTPWFTDMTARGTVIADGAWGTEIQARGLPPGDLADGWNLLRPDAVRDVARSYVEAGCDVVLTNTFRANNVALAGYGLAGKAAEINRAGAALSREAAGGRARVFGSIGPSGKLLSMDQVSIEVLHVAFFEQALALAEGGVDALVVETMSDLAEAACAVRAAATTGLPIVASMVFDAGKHHDRTMMGNTPEQAAEVLAEAGASAIGANCGSGIAAYVPVCGRLHAASSLPIWIKPNAGLPVLQNGIPVYSMLPAQFAAFLPALTDAGATFVGGCCGTSPAFIERLVRARAGG